MVYFRIIFINNDIWVRGMNGNCDMFQCMFDNDLGNFVFGNMSLKVCMDFFVFYNFFSVVMIVKLVGFLIVDDVQVIINWICFLIYIYGIIILLKFIFLLLCFLFFLF